MKSEDVRMALLWCAIGAIPLFAQKSVAPAFSSPAEAVQALVQAVQNNDTARIEKVLGGPTALASSHDEEQDKLDRDLLLKKYQEMHRLHRETDGSVTLYVGAENWPFPVPMIEQGGAWRFDPEAGANEVLFRRIGENEINAIEQCHQALAAASGTSAGVPVDGYYFRVLSAGSGAAVVAFPADYRQSGVMTFVLTRKGAVYEKDLGVNTPALAGAMTSFRSDATWRRVIE